MKEKFKNKGERSIEVRTESIGITQHPGEVYGVAEGHRRACGDLCGCPVFLVADNGPEVVGMFLETCPRKYLEKGLENIFLNNPPKCTRGVCEMKTEDKQVEKNKRQKLHDQKQADKVRKEEEKKKKEEEKKKKKTEEPPKKRVNPARSTKTTTQKEKSQDAQTPPKKKLRPIKTAALLTPLTSTSKSDHHEPEDAPQWKEDLPFIIRSTVAQLPNSWGVGQKRLHRRLYHGKPDMLNVSR
ncbi:hypothetical protein PSTG_14084 [Puccinia striiformis f. sp. tritici PST-78]|uniref:Uncharacterized protein n=1 Tax=Puccinia striiformis f. sp. tritici PST-78 TaxID=1165861 RepID=A0A0L0V0G8_9BASI|nr:hypothetical protein PSTG_14084 [Puccinia striiformis f. sp. tritici PST-78]